MLNSATDIFDPVFFSEATKARKASLHVVWWPPSVPIEPDSSMIIRTSRPHALVRSGLSMTVVSPRIGGSGKRGEEGDEKRNSYQGDQPAWCVLSRALLCNLTPHPGTRNNENRGSSGNWVGESVAARRVGLRVVEDAGTLP